MRLPRFVRSLPTTVRTVALSYGTDSLDDAHRAFDALSAGGQVTMPLAPTFWAALFGMCTDKFGVGWMVNVESDHDK